ncbi:hypothetical protein BX666DRAFT_1985001 [Dichotomocladium elegans]|nr:hypothetical protein BX666DRAFT_1985001 [Dichotomocladium elegans]
MDTDKQPSMREQKKLPTASQGQTLFVRNLLFDSNEESLKKMFTRWGPVVYARITRNKHTGVSRGTGFVCMKNKADADKCLEEFHTFKKNSIRDMDEGEDGADLLMTKREKKKLGMVFDSILTPDAGSGVGLKFTLDGRVLEITRAVERNEASKLTEEKANLRKKEDKRNIYLMHEGVVFPGTPAAETMPPAELQKRQMAFATRKRLMSRDPSLFISKTRLSIRNLPTSIDDTDLKKLGYSAIEKFKEQVKKNLRSDLTKEEKEEGWQYKARIKQGKIVRSKDRIDSSTSKLRSKGYGFLEYTTHAHALAALRYLNNNPDLFNGRRLIVEFSIENKDVVNRRQERLSGKNRSHNGEDEEKKPFNSQRQQKGETTHAGDGKQENGKPRRGGGANRGARGARGGSSRGGSSSRGRGGSSRGRGASSRGRGGSSRGRGGNSRGRGRSE